MIGHDLGALSQNLLPADSGNSLVGPVEPKHDSIPVGDEQAVGVGLHHLVKVFAQISRKKQLVIQEVGVTAVFLYLLLRS